MIIRIILLILLCHTVRAQNFNAAPYQGMGNTGIAMESIYSLTHNAAGIARLQQVEVAIAYQSHFNLSDLNSQAMYFAVPLRRTGGFGIAVHHYGMSGITSYLTGKVAYSRLLGSKLSASISANYYQKHIKELSSSKSLSADLGVLLNITQKTRLGAYYKNISASRYDDELEQYVPREIGVGLSHVFSKQVTLGLDAVYDWMDEWSYRFGIAYAINDWIIIRTGASTGPTQYYIGLGFMYKRFKVDLSSSFHRELGVSPQISLAYAF